MERIRLHRIDIRGFKSFDSKGEFLRLGDLTVLIGANGAGKSNLVSLFALLQSFTSRQLQNWVGRQGFAQRVLHYGADHTPHIFLSLEFKAEHFTSSYHIQLSHVPGDQLVITNEAEAHTRTDMRPHPEDPFRLNEPNPGYDADNGYRRESNVFAGSRSAAVLEGCRAYQFHDTAPRSTVRNNGPVADHITLHADGGNLAAFLYQLKAAHPNNYRRIVQYLRRLVPSFHDFVLVPPAINPNYIKLNWTSDGEHTFGPEALSDGTVRLACLLTLLLQPDEQLPRVMVIDEPELGLHPAALHMLAGLLNKAARKIQVILATQSAALLDAIEPEQTVVIEYDTERRASIIQHKTREGLQEWLKDYTLGELWEKNVLGGRP